MEESCCWTNILVSPFTGRRNSEHLCRTPVKLLCSFRVFTNTGPIGLSHPALKSKLQSLQPRQTFPENPSEAHRDTWVCPEDTSH